MNQTAFHRLIGAIIIGLLAVVLLPIFFDGANVTNIMGEGFTIEDRVIEDTQIDDKNDNDAGVDKTQKEASVKAVSKPDSSSISVGDIRKKIEQIEGLHEPVEANAAEDKADDDKPRVIESNKIALSDLQKKALEKIEPAWSIRTATYFDKEIADAAMKKLRQAGYLVYFKTKKRSTDGKTVYLVNVGPYMLESDAKLAQKKIHKLMGINDSMLLRYIP